MEVLGVIGFVLSIVTFLLIMVIIPVISYNRTDLSSRDISPTVDNTETDGISDDFTKAQAMFFDILTLTMFEMYLNCEITDFEEQTVDLLQHMDKMAMNESHRENIRNKYNNYLKENVEGSENDDFTDGY